MSLKINNTPLLFSCVRAEEEEQTFTVIPLLSYRFLCSKLLINGFKKIKCTYTHFINKLLIVINLFVHKEHNETSIAINCVFLHS